MKKKIITFEELAKDCPGQDEDGYCEARSYNKVDYGHGGGVYAAYYKCRKETCIQWYWRNK